VTEDVPLLLTYIILLLGNQGLHLVEHIPMGWPHNTLKVLKELRSQMVTVFEICEENLIIFAVSNDLLQAEVEDDKDETLLIAGP